MAKFCPECGFKLEGNFNFCPECGFDLKNSEVKQRESEDTPEHAGKGQEIPAGKIVCDNCGELNDSSSYVCSGCGAKLREGKQSPSAESKPKESPQKPRKNSTKQSAAKSKNKQHSKNGNSAATVKRQLSTAKLVSILFVAFGLALMILIFSGALDSFLSPSSQHSAVSGEQNSSGVDLSNINKINTLEAKLKANPRDTASILELAHLKNDSGLYSQAIVNYKQYLELVPGDPDARIDMGICYYNLKDYDTAIKEMKNALEYDPKHQIGYLDLGIVNLTAGNVEESNKWLKKAVKLDPLSDYGKKAAELLNSHTNINGGK